MAQEISISNSTNKCLIHMPGRGMAAKVAFDSNHDAFIHKHVASTLRAYLNSPNGEDVLTQYPHLKDAFKDEVERQGMTLVDAVREALNLFDSAPTPMTPITTPERFVGLLAQVAPNETGEACLERLKQLIDDQGDKAVELFTQHEAKNGRDEDGYVRLRSNKSKKAVA